MHREMIFVLIPTEIRQEQVTRAQHTHIQKYEYDGIAKEECRTKTATATRGSE